MVATSKVSASLERAWYSAPITEFLAARWDTVLGQLAGNSDFSVDPAQRDAWLAQIQLLQDQLSGLDGWLFMEFSIPRMGRRIDTVLIIGPVVYVLEFKIGETHPDRSAMDQVWDYALDLKNFHEGSHSAAVVPILITTASLELASVQLLVDADNVYRPISIHAAALRATLDVVSRQLNGDQIQGELWGRASYHPTPTIVEAARALYAQHSVEAITRRDADAKNLAITSRRIEELVDAARSQHRKAICFVTGVPGAGKTLVGLNVATQRRDRDQPTHAVYLSGNGPLVDVLREALTRDEFVRQKDRGVRVRKSKVAESVKAFIQNVHHFRDDLLVDTAPPAEHVAIFDEAQRAWNVQQTANFMRRKRKLDGFSQSEPEFLISCMDRHADWAVIVCLVGGGQEINTGEAGIDSWIDAIQAHFPRWDMHVSSKLTDSEYGAGRILEVARQRQNTAFDDSLHLAVSMRSFRAENVSAFVKAILDRDKADANQAFNLLADRYPIVITRNLATAKNWILNKARGSERYGIVASSNAHRLKPDAIDIRIDVDPVQWFLNDRSDTRSSYYLEDAATEFQVQGLELDWVCVAWDGDMRYSEQGWNYHSFRGDRWCRVGKPDRQRYQCNAYRVLLTRARQGMVVYVPPGSSSDPTRLPEFYDATYRYLREVGIPQLS
jgi:hypothetical protein